MNTPLEQLCCLATNPYPSERINAELLQLSDSINDWSALTNLVNTHRIGALLYWHHQQGNIKLPKQAEIALLSGYLRNKKIALLRDKWLSILTDKLNTAGITHAYLKGASLCHLSHPTPFTRSMDDIDILIDQSRNKDVYDILKSLNVSVTMPTSTRELGRHQWDVATVHFEGVKFDIEIHTRVLSRRIGGYGLMSGFQDTLISFEVDGQKRHALSHEDFIITQMYRFKHLTEIFRLIDITDIFAYLERFADNIDWQNVYTEHSWLRNAFAAIDAVTPLSGSVREAIMLPSNVKLAFDLNRSPYNGLPVNRYLRAKGLLKSTPFIVRLLNTIAPSAWWMTLVYGTSEKLSSRLICYFVKHPFSVIKQTANAFIFK